MRRIYENFGRNWEKCFDQDLRASGAALKVRSESRTSDLHIANLTSIDVLQQSPGNRGLDCLHADPPPPILRGTHKRPTYTLTITIALSLPFQSNTNFSSRPSFQCRLSFDVKLQSCRESRWSCECGPICTMVKVFRCVGKSTPPCTPGIEEETIDNRRQNLENIGSLRFHHKIVHISTIRWKAVSDIFGGREKNGQLKLPQIQTLNNSM